MERFAMEQFKEEESTENSRVDKGRREGFRKVAEPFKKFLGELNQPTPKNTKEVPPSYSGEDWRMVRREFIGKSIKGITAIALVHAFEKLERFSNGDLEVFAEQATIERSDCIWIGRW